MGVFLNNIFGCRPFGALLAKRLSYRGLHPCLEDVVLSGLRILVHIEPNVS